ncbi:unnamed protein product [Orchesella dallaii]|uniref:Uncharacterized protein n=1 Tax=Orchesella dallaii TaxID=48710 RepID=A0ABP1R9V4_9HEXA
MGSDSDPPCVFKRTVFQMTTPVMEVPSKALLQQPATEPPPSCRLLPTSHLLFPGLPTLEMEGLGILDLEPLDPSPGEAPNWSNYGTYLQQLAAYNATGIKISQPSKTAALLNSDSNRISRTSNSTRVRSSSKSCGTKVTPNKPRNSEHRRAYWRVWRKQKEAKDNAEFGYEYMQEKRREKWRLSNLRRRQRIVAAKEQNGLEESVKQAKKKGKRDKIHLHHHH